MANIDKTEYSFFGHDFPAVDWEDVTPNDSTDLSRIPRALYVGGDGDVEIVSKNGNTSVLSSVPAGAIIPVQPTRVRATNTTATNIIALY